MPVNLQALNWQVICKSRIPDMLLFDNYPRFSFPASDRNTWYSTMASYRTTAMLGWDGTGMQPIAYGQYLNLYRNSYNAATPSESFVRLQQNASWAFGYTFVSAFAYNDPLASNVYPVMFNSAGDTNPNAAVFTYVAETNRQSRNLGPALVRLVSTDIRMIPATYRHQDWFLGSYHNHDLSLPATACPPGRRAPAATTISQPLLRWAVTTAVRAFTTTC